MRGVIYKYFLNRWQWEINNSDSELSVEKGTILWSWIISGNGDSAIPNDLMGL